MKSSREKLIEARAYELWEKEGRPHGAHERHWYQATQEVDAAATRKPAQPKESKVTGRCFAGAKTSKLFGIKMNFGMVTFAVVHRKKSSKKFLTGGAGAARLPIPAGPLVTTSNPLNSFDFF